MQSSASSRTAPGVCSWDLLSSDINYFGRTVIGCVMKGSSPHTQGTQRHKGKQGTHNIPVRDTSPWAGLGLSQRSFSFMSWRWDPPQGKQEQLPSSPHRSERYRCLGMGHIAGCRGRASANCTEPSMGWVRGGTSVKGKEGSKWFREKQVWESRGKGDQVASPL